jgi:hypothetical protein
MENISIEKLGKLPTDIEDDSEMINGRGFKSSTSTSEVDDLNTTFISTITTASVDAPSSMLVDHGEAPADSVNNYDHGEAPADSVNNYVMENVDDDDDDDDGISEEIKSHWNRCCEAVYNIFEKPKVVSNQKYFHKIQ